jgi:UDP-N-acetylmuramoyl-tripeptide--D-alanyl-D-alanine ligase
VEFFKSPREVFEEKAALAKAVKRGGAAVLFADDERIMALGGELSNKGISVLTYGANEKASARGTDFGFEYVRSPNYACPTCEVIKKDLVCSFKITTNDGTLEKIIYKNPLGKTGMYPLLAATAVGMARGMAMSDIKEGLGEYEAPRGRMNALKGVNDSILIDDSYNSSPDAALSALETLKELTCSGRKIAILGDMMELGKYSAEEHRKIGGKAASVADILVTVGLRSRATADEALKNGIIAGNVSRFDSSEEAAEFMPRIIKPNDIILIKGSQAARMERVVRALLNEPQKAAQLLVRQEPEWLERL